MLNATNDQAAAIPVSDSWRQWIAENRLLRADERSMIEALVRNGIAEEVARGEVEAATGHPYLQGAEWIAQRLRSWCWVRARCCFCRWAGGTMCGRST